MTDDGLLTHHSRELLTLVLVTDRKGYVKVFHSPECGIPAGEYWRVTVERVPLGQPFHEPIELTSELIPA